MASLEVLCWEFMFSLLPTVNYKAFPELLFILKFSSLKAFYVLLFFLSKSSIIKMLLMQPHCCSNSNWSVLHTLPQHYLQTLLCFCKLCLAGAFTNCQWVPWWFTVDPQWQALGNTLFDSESMHEVLLTGQVMLLPYLCARSQVCQVLLYKDYPMVLMIDMINISWAVFSFAIISFPLAIQFGLNLVKIMPMAQ